MPSPHPGRLGLPPHRLWWGAIVLTLGTLLVGGVHCAALLHGPGTGHQLVSAAAPPITRPMAQPAGTDALPDGQACALPDTELRATSPQAPPTGTSPTSPVGRLAAASTAPAAAPPVPCRPECRASGGGRSILTTVCRWRI